jgi:hypothetical protein
VLGDGWLRPSGFSIVVRLVQYETAFRDLLFPIGHFDQSEMARVPGLI